MGSERYFVSEQRSYGHNEHGTDEKIFISAVTVRELIHEDNTSLTLYSELEKCITKETVVQKQIVTKQEKHTTQKKLQSKEK